MNQLPIFVTLKGRKVILVGEGDAADAKRRLIERAGGLCVDADTDGAVLAFVAIEDTQSAADVAHGLKAKGRLVNVVDQPALCDFTTPAIVDRDPLLVAIGTGGASAGLAKAIRQKLETIFPQNLGLLAKGLSAARTQIRDRWPEPSARRKAIDDALSDAGILDPFAEKGDDAVAQWLETGDSDHTVGLHILALQTANPDDLTLRQARLLGQADHIYHTAAIPDAIVNRARADAIRHAGEPADPLPAGLVLQLVMTNTPTHGAFD